MRRDPGVGPRDSRHTATGGTATGSSSAGGGPAGGTATVTAAAAGAGPGPGLTSTEAAQRRAQGLHNTIDQPTSRPLAGILRANILTRFNAVVTALAVVVLAVGDPIDASFALVMVINAVIGVVQELRAKRTLDAIRLLLTPSVEVWRDGRLTPLAPSDMVRDDIFAVAVGDQLPVDAEVVAANGLEVDESALTGESLPVPKSPGDEALSGSSVVAGSATARAIRVGNQSWAQQLTAEARTFSLTRSELRVGIDQLLRVVSWLLAPLGFLLFWSQLRRSASDLSESVVAAVAGMEALIPQGLVLLVSMSMAVAIVRLAQRQVVVQELYAVEGLARIDTLCLDKTGTLTTGNLVVDRIEPAGSGPVPPPPLGELAAALRALISVPGVSSTTLDALGPALVPLADPASWPAPAAIAPFSSERKWSGARFDGHGAWIVGAPEILLDATTRGTDTGGTDTGGTGKLAEEVGRLADTGRRVLLVAHSRDPRALAGPDQPHLPQDLTIAGLVALKEQVRPDAAETLAFFARQGVDVKVISGDNPRTVAAVVAELGLDATGRTVDLRPVEGPEALAQIAADTLVFGRVRPEQKRDLIRLLQDRGATVAMTGDGVNDIPSLKAADIGIAMNTATPATRAVAQLVLLDGRFARLPGVVAEGRRVIANMERVSALFITKTVYAAIMALAVGVTGIPFPFLPRHLSLVAAVTIGVPAFALSFRSTQVPCRPGYLRRVLRFAIPSGVAAAVVTLAAFALVQTGPAGDADLTQARTAATIALTAFGLWILYLLTRPLDRVEGGLLAAMAGVSAALLVPSPLSRLYLLELPPTPGLAVTALVVAAIALVLVLVSAALEVRQPSKPR